MSQQVNKVEQLCGTSEKQKVIFTEAELMEIKANIGRRIAEAFNYQSDSEIASLLTISNKAVKSFIDGEEFPPIEILLSIRQVTDVSLDWLLTTEEVKQGSYTKRFSSSIEPVVLGLA